MRLISYYTALWSSSCCWIYPAAPATLKITVENIVQARSWHSMNLTEFSRPGKQRSYEGETENGRRAMQKSLLCRLSSLNMAQPPGSPGDHRRSMKWACG